MKRLLLLVLIISCIFIRDKISLSQNLAGFIDQTADFAGNCQQGQTGYASISNTFWVCHFTGTYAGNVAIYKWLQLADSTVAGNEYTVGTGYRYPTVDALVETLSGNSVAVIHDKNCSGTNGVGDDWTVDPWNPTNGLRPYLVVTYGPCQYPLATEVSLAIGQSGALFLGGPSWLMGVSGRLGSVITGGLMIAGPNFTPGPITGVGPTPNATDSTSCGGNTFTAGQTLDLVATYYQNPNLSGSNKGINGQTIIGSVQSSLVITAGHCVSYTAPVQGSLPVNSVGVSIFATLHSTLGAYSWQMNVPAGQTMTFPTSGGSTTFVTNNPSPPGFNTSGAMVYLGRRNENIVNAGNEQFGINISGYLDANGIANYCVVNVGAEEQSGPMGLNCKNEVGPAGYLVEGFNGSVTSNNSGGGKFNFGSSSCSVTNPCGGYPGLGSITTFQEPSIAPIIVDQISGFRGFDDITCTPNSASAPTVVACILVVGTTGPEAQFSGQGASFNKVHAEGPSSGSNIVAAIKSCGAAIDVGYITSSSKNAVDLDDLNSTACQTYAPQSFTTTPVSQPAYGSHVSHAVVYSGGAHAILDHTTGYTTTAGITEANYFVQNSAIQYYTSSNPVNIFYITQETARTGAAVSPVTTNNIRISAFYVPRTATFGNMIYDVQTADNTTNTYDVGAYGPGCLGAAANVPLVWHTGSVAGTTLASATGVLHIALLANATMTPGWYCFAFTSPSTSPTLVFGGDATGNHPGPFAPATISGGGSTLPGTITAPGTSWLGNTQPWIGLYQ